MRTEQAITTTAELLRKYLDTDVADAIINDATPFKNAAERFGFNLSRNAMEDWIKEIARRLDDSTADWLVERADSPGTWFHQMLSKG